MKKILLILLVTLIIAGCQELDEQLEVAPKTWLVSPVSTPTVTPTAQATATAVPWEPVSIDWCKLVATCP